MALLRGVLAGEMILYVLYIYIHTNFNVYTPIVYTCIFPAECAILYTTSKQINCWHSLLPIIRGSQNAPCPGCLGFVGDDKLTSYNRDYDKANISIPIKQPVFMECHKSFPMLWEVFSRLSKWVGEPFLNGPRKTWVSNSSITTY